MAADVEFHDAVRDAHTAGIANMAYRKQLSESTMRTVKGYAGELIQRARERVGQVLADIPMDTDTLAKVSKVCHSSTCVTLLLCHLTALP